MAAKNSTDALAIVDIVKLAQRLGVQVGRESDGQARALCPFHKESTPSFTLYQPRADGRSHYHCFGCQVHGGALDLVRGLTDRRTFREAGLWLEENGFLDHGAFSSPAGQGVLAQPALDFLFERLQGQRSAPLLRSFAQSRGFDAAVLRRADIVAGDLAPIIATIAPDSQVGLDLIEEGLARSANVAVFDREAGPPALRSTIIGTRILIPIRDQGGMMVGLAARALNDTDTPKYKLPAGFSRGAHLYGLDVVRDELARTDRPLDVFVVEGVFDALRLRTLGLQAVALLGTQITEDQFRLLDRLSSDAAGLGRITRVHLFLDYDRPGLTAAARLLPRLLAESVAAKAPYLVDAIIPDTATDEAGDPDSLLRGVGREVAAARLRAWARPALDVVAATLADLPIENVREAWAGLDWTAQFQAAQRIGRVLGALEEGRWRNIQARLRPDLVAYGDAPTADQPADVFAEQLASLLEGRDSRRDQALAVSAPQGDADYPARLVAAIELARESASSREYPVDVAAWERLLEAAVVFAPLLRSRLSRADGPIRPFIAHFLPRASGKPRLKCGPCPEDAALQQYVLGELLRTHNSQTYTRAIPAVRWWPSVREARTTGRGGASNTTVSFAYQIDMEALESRPDRSRRRDMFRPFIDCWNAYIAFAGHRISRMRGGTVHVARLDISRFYDELPRVALETKLRTALETAMSLSGVLPATLLRPDLIEPAARARATTDWLLAHSMGDPDLGYAYFHPLDSRPLFKATPRKGLPQGPTLSAYLANIALFDLDQVMADEVAERDRTAERGRGYGGLYARYVDDIILAAPSEAELRSLIARVEGRVNALGLRLNEKSEVLLPKTKSEAREWLVERRGAGFFEYGDASEAPTPILDGPSSWGDAPDLDRRAALHVVLDTNLDDPRLTSGTRLRALLKQAGHAAEAPHGDFGHIARRLWLRAAIDDAELAGPGIDMPADRLDRLSEEFATAWASVVPPSRFRDATPPEDDDDESRALRESLEALAVLDGVERLLMAAPHRNPTLTEEGRKEIAKGRDVFVAAIAKGLLNPVLRRALNGKAGLRDQLRQAQAILEARAATIQRLEAHRPPTRGDETLPALKGERALLSVWIGQLATYDAEGPHRLLQIVGQVLADAGADDTASVLLHTGLAYLQAIGRLDGAGASIPGQMELLDLQASNLLAGVEVTTFPAPDEFRLVLGTLRVWMTANPDPLAPDVGRAIIAFVLILRGSAVLNDLLFKRPAVTEFLGGAGMKPIPQPALPGLPGLFLRNGRQICAVLLDEAARKAPEDHLPQGFGWMAMPSSDDELYSRHQIDLDVDWEFLSETAAQRQPSSPEVVALYRAFYDLIRTNIDQASTPLTSRYALITGPPPNDAEDRRAVGILAWRVDPASIRDLAFPDRGGSLGIERLVQSEGDWLWRLGRAFNDLYGTNSLFEGVAEDDAYPTASRLEVALRRKVLNQLSGPRLRSLGFNSALRQGKLPTTLERGLTALESVTGRGRPVIWLHFLEGRLMAERMRHAPAFAETPGGAAHLLAAVGRRTVLPRDDAEGLEADPNWIASPFGHDVNAWNGIAGGVRNLSRAASGDDAHQLDLVALGVELHALTLGFRDLALALMARLRVKDRELIELARPELQLWNFGADAVLIRSAFGVQETTRAEFNLDDQVGDLFKALYAAAVGSRRAAIEQDLWRITLLGWVVAVGVLTAALPARFSSQDDDLETRPALPPLREGSPLPEVLADLARRLLIFSAGTLDPEPGWPWGLFSSADQTLGQSGRDVLAAVLDGAELEFRGPYRTSQFVTQDHGGPIRVQDGRFGELQLSPFQYVVSGLLFDQRRDLQVVVQEAGGVEQVWGGVFPKGGSQPLVVTRLTEALAKRTAKVRDDLDSTGGDAAGVVHVGSSPDSARQDSPAGIDPIAPAAPPPQPPQEPSPPTQIPISSAPNAIDRIQRDAWRARGQSEQAGEDAETGRHTARIAFLQCDFEESYDDPKAKDLRHGRGKLKAEDQIGPLEDGSEAILCSEEWRRRRVLERVVEACEAFQVDILVLPEYSVRPETVMWLGRRLEEAKSTLSIWAGTFRVPSQFAISVDRERFSAVHHADTAPEIPGRDRWSRLEAIAPVIFRDRIPAQNGDRGEGGEALLHLHRLGDRLYARQKRYPAIAFHETFKPAPKSSTLGPLLADSRSPWRPESFVFELICSEIFAFNGAINTDSIAATLAKLLVAFRMAPNHKAALDDAKSQLSQDQEVFAKWVSHDFRRRYWPRRSILIAPCITRRSLDYHALGVTAHLSAGVTTIFCNSVVQGYSNGGSCIIGFGATETRDVDVGYIEGPYHGAVPGFYAPMVKGAEPLGERERALVIVDVDPEHPTQSNPRPQYRSDPARLVAHLPIITHAPKPDIQSGWRGCIPTEAMDAHAAEVETLDVRGRGETTFTTNVPDPSATGLSLNAKAAGLCHELSRLSPDSPGLKMRAKMFADSSAKLPQQWPPPALVDWIGVDLNSRLYTALVDTALERDPNQDLDHDQYPWIWTKPPN